MSAPGTRDLVWRVRKAVRRALSELRLEFVRHRLLRAADGSVVHVAGLRLRITDGPNAYMQYKDEFVRRNYAFTTEREAPVVIDGGANMGMFTLATLRDHPRARITAFEPDPALIPLLRANLDQNGASHVTVVNAALGGEDAEMGFSPDGQAGGMLDKGEGLMRVRVERLSRYLDQEVDFLKLNIEGAELEVVRELRDGGRIGRVRAMVIEYHGWPTGEQRLGALLSLLDSSGFRYLVHDQDDQSNPRTKPPFRAPGAEPWFALVYAWRANPVAGD
ncbi:MAG: FkbM family methyltransferase [Gemmatimonadales bacterium]